MRWLYHLAPRGQASPTHPAPDGFIHASFRDELLASARLHFPAGADLVALPIDPRRLDVRVELADTPRGPMPHIHGPVARDAVGAPIELDAIGAAPDRVTGTRFAFVVFEDLTLLDLVGALDPLSRIASMGFDPTSTVTIVSATGPRVWSQGGAALTVDEARPALDAFDVVVVPGGHGTRALEADAGALAWIAAYPHNRLLASVCTGALLLGAAGRLRGRRATTHHRELGRLAAFGATAVEARVVDAWPIVTAGGVTSALDLGLYLVRWLEGAEVAAAIARQMQMPEGWDSGAR